MTSARSIQRPTSPPESFVKLTPWTYGHAIFVFCNKLKPFQLMHEVTVTIPECIQVEAACRLQTTRCRGAALLFPSSASAPRAWLNQRNIQCSTQRSRTQPGRPRASWSDFSYLHVNAKRRPQSACAAQFSFVRLVLNETAELPLKLRFCTSFRQFEAIC